MSVLEVRLEKLGDVFKRNYPLIGILLGSALMSISLGPYSSWDSQLEFTAASGVVKWGLPYITYGETINMQPLGFYVEAFFLKTFGVSYEVAVGDHFVRSWMHFSAEQNRQSPLWEANRFICSRTFRSNSLANHNVQSRLG